MTPASRSGCRTRWRNCAAARGASSGSIRLCNRPGYAPICQGMQAALPHLDLLAPGADLASIKAVLPQLIEALR